MVWLVLVACCFFSQAVEARAVDIYTFSSEQENQRFLNLTKELRCLVCQNQSLADSDAVLANDLRNKIYALIQAKKSDEEIRAFLVSRYGEFILFSPPLKRATLLLWSFPAILLGILVAGGVMIVRKNRLLI